MIDVASFRDRPIAVMGLGRSGLATAEALLASGARLAAWDESEAQRDAATARGIPLTDLGRSNSTFFVLWASQMKFDTT